MKDVRYPIELEVITPLSVGAGNDNEWICGIDYVQKDGKVYVLDIQKAVAKGVDVDRLTNLFLKLDEKGICQLLGGQIENVSRFIFSSPVSTTNPIKSFLRTQLYDKPIVAGSSLKGAVRSALFNYLRTDEKTNEEVFGNMKDGTDLMRFFHITDIEMPSTQLVNTKIFNLRKDEANWCGGWKHGGARTDNNYSPTGFNTLYECVVPGKKGYGSITLAGNAFAVMSEYTTTRISYLEKKQALLNDDIIHLFMAINDVTREYLRKERDFFIKYPAERSNEIEENIDYLRSLIPPDGSCCLLKMSAGVGFHSITGDWQFKDYDDTGSWSDLRNYGKKKYKSRKTAEYDDRLQLMGFVMLRRLSDEEAVSHEQSLKKKHLDIKEAILAPIKAKEIAKQKKAEEDSLRAKAKAEEERKQKEYHSLIQQAQQYYNEGQFDQAIASLQEAAALYPNAQGHNLLLEKCNKARDVEAFLQNERAATAQKFSQPLAEVIKGKTSVGNLVGTTAKWLKAEGHVFGETEFQALLNEAQQLSPKEKSRLKSKRRDLIKTIGEESANRFFSEIGLLG